MADTDSIDLLLVEDECRDAEHIERLLVEFGSIGDLLVRIDTVTRAGSLATACECLDDSPDAVLLDLTLPDSDGLETLEAVIEHAPHVPVVVITGTHDAGLGPEAIRLGAQDYLTKGHITAELLHRTIRYALDRHENQHEILTLNRRLALLTRLLRQDVRADVSMVVGRADELRRVVDPGTEPVVESLLAATERAVERTDRANELLRVLSPDHEPALEPLDIEALVREQAERARERFDATVEVTRTDTGDGDATAEATVGLGSALEELLSNAVRHTESDHPHVRVRIEVTPDEVSVSLADEGVGIPDARKELLNDSDARYHERSGIGTGLYLVMMVIEQSGGTIEFTDNEPRGTVVTVTVARAG